MEVARALLGKTLSHGKAAGRIVEVEAYLGPHYQEVADAAAHSARGVTERTHVIFGAPGHAYVYLIYGMYECLNLVAEPAGVAGCVLIRAIEPLRGIDRSTNGPGKLTRAMGITRKHNGVDVTRGPLLVSEPDGPFKFDIGVSPRIGITKSADLPLRFFIKGNSYLSRVKSV